MNQSIYNFFNKSFKIKINWALIIFFLIFFTYGFYGVISKDNNLLFTLLTIINLSLFYFLAKEKKSYFKDELKVNYFDFLNFIIFFLILIIINFNHLTYSLFGDELAHTLRASRTSIYGIYLAITKFNINYFENYEFRKLVHIANFLLLIFLFLSIYILKYSYDYKILFFFIIATIVFRVFLKDYGMHPPLDHIFTFLIISLFGISDFTGNISYLFGFTFFQLFLFHILYKNFSYLVSFLATISIFTIPLLLSMSTWAESAIWSSMFLIIVLLEIFFSKKINYVRLISIISIGTLFRISIFITIIPLLIFFIYDFLKKNKNLNIKNILEEINVFYPILLFVPFLFNSIFFGTPSFDGINNLNLFEKIIYAWKSNIIWIAVVNSLPYWWIIFFPIAFFMKGKNSFSRFILLLYLLICIVVYYSINPGLWGLAKYPGEYALPFCILGFFYFINLLIKNKLNEKFIYSILFLLIISNIYRFHQIPLTNKSQDLILDTWQKDIKKVNKNNRLFNGELVFNLKEAFSYIKKNGLEGKTYVLGTTYGFLPEILNGYKVAGVRETKKIINNQMYLKQMNNYRKEGIIDIAERINKDQQIKAVLITDKEQISSLIENLKKKNWKYEKNFINEVYGSTVYLMVRN